MLTKLMKVYEYKKVNKLLNFASKFFGVFSKYRKYGFNLVRKYEKVWTVINIYMSLGEVFYKEKNKKYNWKPKYRLHIL